MLPLLPRFLLFVLLPLCIPTLFMELGSIKGKNWLDDLNAAKLLV